MEDRAMLGSNLSAMRGLRCDGRAAEITAARLYANTSHWNLKAKNPMPKLASAKPSNHLFRNFLAHFAFDEYFVRPMREAVTNRIGGDFVGNAFMLPFAIKLRADDHGAFEPAGFNQVVKK